MKRKHILILVHANDYNANDLFLTLTHNLARNNLEYADGWRAGHRAPNILFTRVLSDNTQIHLYIHHDSIRLNPEYLFSPFFKYRQS